MADTRKLAGGRPVIGIRPIIDGRKGPLDVRGSLEEQTMSMARRAKSSLRKMYSMQTGLRSGSSSLTLRSAVSARVPSVPSSSGRRAWTSRCR